MNDMSRAGIAQGMYKAMRFPGSYRRALETGAKNTTMRMSDELGKYRVGGTYQTGSYSGQRWPVRIRVTNIDRKKARDVKRVRELHTIPSTTDVDVIRFEVMR